MMTSSEGPFLVLPRAPPTLNPPLATMHKYILSIENAKNNNCTKHIIHEKKNISKRNFVCIILMEKSHFTIKKHIYVWTKTYS